MSAAEEACELTRSAAATDSDPKTERRENGSVTGGGGETGGGRASSAFRLFSTYMHRKEDKCFVGAAPGEP